MVLVGRSPINLTGELAIIQGETYRALTLQFPGDVTNRIPRGQIRTALLQDEGEVLAVFEFDPAVYDSDSDTTTIYPYLAEVQTAHLPKTRYQGTGDITRRNVYYWDIELDLSGDVIKTVPGVVQVIGEVTDNTIIWDPPIFWDGSIDHINLTATDGLTRTYTIWGNSAETINLGEFTVTDGNGIADTSYDEQTGVLTITFDDGSTFQTGDIRGEKGEPGDIAGAETFMPILVYDPGGKQSNVFDLSNHFGSIDAGTFN